MRRWWRLAIQVNVDIDTKFIALLPALNINRHSKSLEFEWLIFAVYLDIKNPSSVHGSRLKRYWEDLEPQRVGHIMEEDED